MCISVSVDNHWKWLFSSFLVDFVMLYRIYDNARRSLCTVLRNPCQLKFIVVIPLQYSHSVMEMQISMVWNVFDTRRTGINLRDQVNAIRISFLASLCVQFGHRFFLKCNFPIIFLIISGELVFTIWTQILFKMYFPHYYSHHFWRACVYNLDTDSFLKCNFRIIFLIISGKPVFAIWTRILFKT